MEVKTAARMAQELRAAGFTVTEGVGGTGVVAVMENGPGPMVMMRADMDGLPLEEKSGLSNASTVRQERGKDDIVPVMHACGHDVHMTSLVGTARIMSGSREKWSGTLMLIGPPVAPHHSPLFKIEPEDSITFGVEATVIALRELLQE